MKTDSKTILAFVGCLVALSGCAKSPYQGDVLDLHTISKDFWLVRDAIEITPPQDPQRAIVEFTIEFVAGGEAGADFSTGMKLELAGILYQEYVEILKELDRSVLDMSVVNGAAAFQKLKGIHLANETLSMNPESPGYTGEPKTSVRYPVDGLLALDDTASDTDAVIRELLKEIGADFSIQLRWRVGVRDGRATIEKGSILRLVHLEDTEVLETRKTMISHMRVVGEEETQAVDSRRFIDATRDLFHTCTSMAIVALGGEP